MSKEDYEKGKQEGLEEGYQIAINNFLLANGLLVQQEQQETKENRELYNAPPKK